jgi:hypothetical protein
MKGRHSLFVSPCQGSASIRFCHPGFRPLRDLHPGLCCAALSGLEWALACSAFRAGMGSGVQRLQGWNSLSRQRSSHVEAYACFNGMDPNLDGAGNGI